MELDSKDLSLLKALQQNASQRLEDLSRLLHLAPSSVHERIRRLERIGAIVHWTIKIDAPGLGLGILAFIGIRAARPCSEMLPALQAMPFIEECHSVAGELSMMLKVRCIDTAGLLALCEKLRQIPGVENTETTMVLKTHIDRPINLEHSKATRKNRPRLS